MKKIEKDQRNSLQHNIKHCDTKNKEKLKTNFMIIFNLKKLRNQT